MHEHGKAIRDMKAARSKEEKKAEKDEKAKLEGLYVYHKWDGNFKVEPPVLFRGRGTHPKINKVTMRYVVCNAFIYVHSICTYNS